MKALEQPIGRSELHTLGKCPGEAGWPSDYGLQGTVQQIYLTGVGWQVRLQTEHPRLARGAVVIPDIPHLVKKQMGSGSLGRGKVVTGLCQPLLTELRE